MTANDVTLRTRLVEGAGSIERLGDLASGFGRRALVVTDAGIVAAGHVERGELALRAAGIEVARFEEVHENPTTDDVERCAEHARDFGPDLLIGLGGGSAIDVAKGTNFLVSCGGALRDYRGRETATAELLPLIAIPTTAGTGSEVQSFALIADATTHEKMACGDPRAAARIALLDPELTLTMPRHVTAQTGLDAIGHAVESAVTKAGNEVSSELACRAFGLAAEAFPRVLSDVSDLEARAAMLEASCLAGRAIENSMLGAAHSMANPLTRHFDVPHGQAVATALPYVVRYNAADPDDGRAASIYAKLAREGRICGDGFEVGDAVQHFVEALMVNLDLAGMPRSMTPLGVTADRCAELAREASQQWTAGFNPRPIDEPAFEALFQEALGA